MLPGGDVNVGAGAGLTVMILDTDASGLPHASVAVHVSVTVPPHPLAGNALNVDGLDVPLIKHAPVNPLVNVIVDAAGNAPHATVIAAGAVIVGNAAGLTVMILDTDASGLPHASVAVHVSVTGPPQPAGVAVNVDGLDVPLIKHAPVNPLVNVIVDAAGNAPQATVIAAGAVIVGNAAGLTVIVRDAVIVLPQTSVNDQVSVTVPPHAVGAAVCDDVTDPLIMHVPDPPLV